MTDEQLAAIESAWRQAVMPPYADRYVGMLVVEVRRLRHALYEIANVCNAHPEWDDAQALEGCISRAGAALGDMP